MFILLLISVGVSLQVLDVARREGVGILPWSPLKVTHRQEQLGENLSQGGWLSGKMTRDEGGAPEGSRVHAQVIVLVSAYIMNHGPAIKMILHIYLECQRCLQVPVGAQLGGPGLKVSVFHPSK